MHVSMMLINFMRQGGAIMFIYDCIQRAYPMVSVSKQKEAARILIQKRVYSKRARILKAKAVE